jgi:hypothetical protein
VAKDQAGAAEQDIRTRGSAALRKKNSGQAISARERKDIERLQRLLDEQSRREHYATVPKKDFCALAGRQHKQVDDLHRNYGAPIEGKEVNLYKFVKWAFDFLAENGRKLLRAETDDELLSGPATTELEGLRRASRLLKELEYGERKKQLLPRDRVHDGLTRIASLMRDCGDSLQRRFGPDALDILNQHLDAAEAEIIALCQLEEDEE